MCYVQTRDEFDFHMIDIQEDFFKLEWEATHGKYLVAYTLKIRNKIVITPIKHGKVDSKREEYLCPRIFLVLEVILDRYNFDAARMPMSPMVTTKELQDLYQNLQEMIWAHAYRSRIEDLLRDMPHTELPGALKFLFLSKVGYFIRLIEPAFFKHLIHAHPFAAKEALFDARIKAKPFFIDKAGADGFTLFQKCAIRMFKPHKEIAYFDSQSVVDPRALDDFSIDWETHLDGTMEQDDYVARFPLEDPTEFLLESPEIKGHYPPQLTKSMVCWSFQMSNPMSWISRSIPPFDPASPWSCRSQTAAECPHSTSNAEKRMNGWREKAAVQKGSNRNERKKRWVKTNHKKNRNWKEEEALRLISNSK
jgi:hypothetical protein